MTDPTDQQLLEFVARLVGWRDLVIGRCTGRMMGDKLDNGHRPYVPDYLTDLNAWHRDVWPKILNHRIATLPIDWSVKLVDVCDNREYWVCANASARERSLALFRALNGKFPEEETT